MSARFLYLFEVINSHRSCYCKHKDTTGYLFVNTMNLLKARTPFVHNTRNTSFFNKQSAEELWKGITSVSNAGRKRGRHIGLAKKKDLNRGQVIGVGKINMQFPGLNAPILRGRELLVQKRLPDDPEREKKIIQFRESGKKSRFMRVHPLLRGWTSAKLGGRKVGPPDPIGEDTFDGFETWILESKLVSTMTDNLGRISRHSIFTITGNKNGLAGFALGKSGDVKVAIQRAKNRAGQKLMYIRRYDEHSVLHDFFAQFGSTKIFVKKMPEGYGLTCHRALKCCCEAIGIKNMYAKVEGARNVQHIIKAFFIGLLQQKTYQQMADEKKLHLIETKKETNNFPVVMASPTEVRKKDEIKTDEILNFTQYIFNGKIVREKKKQPPFYTKLKSWDIKLRKLERVRNHDKVKIRLLAEYGEIRSFLADKYPEARLPLPKKKEQEIQEN